MLEPLRRFRTKEPTVAEAEPAAENPTAPDAASRLGTIQVEIPRLEALAGEHEQARAASAAKMSALSARHDDALASNDDAAVDSIEGEQRQARRRHDAAQILRDRARARLNELYQEQRALQESEHHRQRVEARDERLSELVETENNLYIVLVPSLAEAVARRDSLYQEVFDGFGDVDGPRLCNERSLYRRDDLRLQATARIRSLGRLDLTRFVP